MEGDIDDYTITWNDGPITAALTEPFYQANEILGRAFQKEITSNKWRWPNPPSPRDIVDHGDLRRSYIGERGKEHGDPVYDHAWPQNYAMAVHEGAKFKDGHTMPARPWTKEPLAIGALEKAFGKLVKSTLDNLP